MFAQFSGECCLAGAVGDGGVGAEFTGGVGGEVFAAADFEAVGAGAVDDLEVGDGAVGGGGPVDALAGLGVGEGFGDAGGVFAGGDGGGCGGGAGGGGGPADGSADEEGCQECVEGDFAAPPSSQGLGGVGEELCLRVCLGGFHALTLPGVRMVE